MNSFCQASTDNFLTRFKNSRKQQYFLLPLLNDTEYRFLHLNRFQLALPQLHFDKFVLSQVSKVKSLDPH